MIVRKNIADLRVKVRRNITNILLVVCMFFFSLPMIFIWYSTFWQMNIIYDPFAVVLKILAVIISPWAMLFMAAFFYRRGLKLQTYLLTALFLYAVLTQLFVVFYMQLQFRFPHYPIRELA